MKTTINIRLTSYTVQGVDNRDGSTFEDAVTLTQFDRNHEKKIHKMFAAKAFTVTSILPNEKQRIATFEGADLWNLGKVIEEKTNKAAKAAGKPKVAAKAKTGWDKDNPTQEIVNRAEAREAAEKKVKATKVPALASGA